MRLKKLIITDVIREGAVTFDFETPKKHYRKAEADGICSALTYAMYGDPVLTRGNLTLTFEESCPCVLTRDFSRNTCTLTTSKETFVGADAVNKYLRALLPLSSLQWKTFCETDAKQLFEDAHKDVTACLNDLLGSLSIGDAEMHAGTAKYKKRLGDFRSRDVIIRDLAEEFPEEELLPKISDLSEEIVALQQEQTALAEKIELTEAAVESSDAMKQLDLDRHALAEKEAHVKEVKEKLARSEQYRLHYAAICESASLIEENDGLKEKLQQTCEEIEKASKEVSVGERVLKEKQGEFSRLSANLQGLHTALSELIYNNVNDGQSDEKILTAVSKHFAPVAERLNTLHTEQDILYERLQKTETDVAVHAKNLRDMFTARALDSLYMRNRAQLNRSTERLDALAGAGKNKADLVAACHEAEKRKDHVFRSYILSGNLLQELEALDDKIIENNDANRRMQESLTALENAKETLLQYVEKCRKKTDAADETILSLRIRQQYLNETSALEYGAHCPVCDMPVIEKTDVTAALGDIANKLRQCDSDTASYRQALADYTAKLDEVNLRIGALRAKINTGKGYVESLQNSKLKKIATLEKIYEEAGVRSREKLSELLEQCVREAMESNKTLSELEGLTSTAYVAEENIEEITRYVRELAGEDLGTYFSEAKKKLIAVERDEELPEGSVSGEGPAVEDAADKLREAVKRRKEILAALKTIRQEMEYLQSRSVKVSADDRELTYGRLCIYYAGKQYSAVVEEIRKKEAEKDELFKEVSSLALVMKDKRENLGRLNAEKNVMENSFRANLAYLKRIQKTDGFDENLLKGKTLADIKGEILTPGDTTILKNEADEYDREKAILEGRLKELARLSVITDEDKQLLPERKQSLSNLITDIDKKKDVLDKMYGDLAAGKSLRKKRLALLSEQEAYIKGYSFLTRLPEDVVVIFVAAVNDALKELLPLYTAECEGAHLVLKKNDKTESALSESVQVAVEVAMLNAYRHIVFGILGGTSSIRILRFKYNEVDDEMRDRISVFAQRYNMLALFVR